LRRHGFCAAPGGATADTAHPVNRPELPRRPAKGMRGHAMLLMPAGVELKIS
jgi:hypothetical protein